MVSNFVKIALKKRSRPQTYRSLTIPSSFYPDVICIFHLDVTVVQTWYSYDSGSLIRRKVAVIIPIGQAGWSKRRLTAQSGAIYRKITNSKSGNQAGCASVHCCHRRDERSKPVREASRAGYTSRVGQRRADPKPAESHRAPASQLSFVTVSRNLIEL